MEGIFICNLFKGLNVEFFFYIVIGNIVMCLFYLLYSIMEIWLWLIVIIYLVVINYFFYDFIINGFILVVFN